MKDIMQNTAKNSITNGFPRLSIMPPDNTAKEGNLNPRDNSIFN